MNWGSKQILKQRPVMYHGFPQVFGVGPARLVLADYLASGPVMLDDAGMLNG